MNCWVQIDEEKVAKFKFTDDAVDFAERMDRNPRYKGSVQAFWFGEFCEKPQRIYPEKIYPEPKTMACPHFGSTETQTCDECVLKGEKLKGGA